jgi:hypothetical protein
MEAAPTACELPWGTSTCASCVNTYCCSESSACGNDVPCAAYFRCLGACKTGDWQCRTQCGIDDPFGGAKAFPALTMCTATHCESECGLTCGGVAALDTPPDAAAACQACFEQSSSACASERQCASTADCVDWQQCFASCVTPDCRRTCDDHYGLADAGNPGTASYLGVVPPELSALASTAGVAACGTACALGSNWGCVGHVVLPPVTTGGTTLETRVLDLTSTLPLSGAEVSICRFGDPRCAAPLASPVQSDASGFVTLQVPPAVELLDTLGADSFAQVTSPAIFPALYFLGYPVSEPLAPIAQPYVVVLSVQAGTSFFAPESWDTTRGWVQAQVYDCDGVQAPGVQLAIDPPHDDTAVRPFYYRDPGSPTLDFTATATTSDGAGFGGGFLNVPIDATAPDTVVTITATPIALGSKHSSQVHVLVRAGTLTDVFMFPQ